MRPSAYTAAVLMLALGGVAGAACSSVTDTGTRRGYPGASGFRDASAADAASDGAPRSIPPSPSRDASVRPRRNDASAAGGGRGAARDAAKPRRDAPSDGSDVVSVDAAPASHDAESDVAAETGPASPDCTCPDLGFFLDATAGASSLHLTAPYTLNIYCTETTVQLAHPPCSGVYRLSACNGPDDAPPCVYIAVDRSGAFLLGDFVDADGMPWDILEGDIATDPPSGRVDTGTFSASMRPRGGGDAVVLSGSFRACVTRMPACAS